MANPQPDQFTRISNELYEAIMHTDFSKRHRNIIDLVIRMSYGCGKKFAILRPSDFELVGVLSNHISKELTYLKQANVLIIDGEVIELNKNYTQWRISITKKYERDRFNKVLQTNLISFKSTTKSVVEENSEPPKQWGEHHQNGGSIPLNQWESTTKSVVGTSDFPVNHEADEPPKDIKDNKEILKKEEEAEKHIGHIIKLHEQSGFGTVNPTVVQDINAWIDGNYFDEPIEIILKSLQEANRSNAKSWRYVNKILINWSDKKLRTLDQVEVYVNEFINKAKPHVIIPQSLQDRGKSHQPRQQEPTDEELNQLLAEMVSGREEDACKL